MEQETKEFRKGCFIGGFFTVLVWFLMVFSNNRSLFWFGIIAGLAGGYISYRFKEFIKKAPIAWKYVEDKSGRVFKKSLDAFLEIFRPHPIAHLFTLVCLLVPAMASIGLLLISPKEKIDSFLFFLMLLLMVILVWILLLDGILTCFLDRWKISIKYSSYQRTSCKYIDMPITYRNIFYLLLIAPLWVLGFILWRTIRFFIWDLWRGVILLIIFFLRFLFKLFILVHCQERIMCAVDGTIGGTVVSFWSLHYSNFPIWTVPFLALIGGLAGVAFGEFNRLIVLRKWLSGYIPDQYQSQL